MLYNSYFSLREESEADRLQRVKKAILLVETKSECNKRKYYSGKKKKKTYDKICRTIRYFKWGNFIYISGSYCGCEHDITIARKSGIMELIEPNELIMGDKAYTGCEKIIYPVKVPSNSIEKEWNSFINTQRVIVENTFGRVKNWKCLKVEWRHELNYHRPTFFAVCIMVNLDLFEHPIRINYSN